MTRWITTLGAAVIAELGRLGRTGMFLGKTLLHALTPPVKGERLLRQTWFIGWKSMLVIALTGTFTGMVVALQGFPTLRRVGSEALLGPMVSLSLIRELGPVLTALMVTGRAGSAIAAEIGIMRNSEQIDALECNLGVCGVHFRGARVRRIRLLGQMRQPVTLLTKTKEAAKALIVQLKIREFCQVE